MRRPEIERLLPAVFRRGAVPGTPLDALLDVMEGLHAPAEDALATFDEKLDARRAPEAFLPLLASWVGLDFAVTTGPGRLRELIASAARLAAMRGTRRGLIELLEVATGVTGFEIDEQVVKAGAVRPFHMRVRAPAATAPHRGMLESIIEREKPAHLTSELIFTP